MTLAFKRGQEVVWRSRPQGEVGYTIPLTVVEDSAEAIALVQRDGCTCMRRTGARGGPNGRSMLPGGWDGGHAPVRWAPGHDTVRVHVPGTAHSVIRHWHAGTAQFEGWYINLELPWTRTPIGFDTHDLILDVAIEGSDLASARLKDEDELAWSVERGTISREEARLAREEADRVLQVIPDRAGLFAADWERWRPDPAWPIPELPPDWKSA